MQRQIMAGLAGLLLLTALPAYSDNSQQDKMKTCNADATGKGLKGGARQGFMSCCLSATPAAAGASQQDKMKTCNADATAKGLKGGARQGFMSCCLSSGR